MAKFNAEQQDEIKKALGFWRALAIEKETAAKNEGHIKEAEAKAYRATFRAIIKLTRYPKHKKEQEHFQIFWGAAIKRWDIDFIRYIPLQLSGMYEQYYIVPPISLKARNAHVAKILTAIKKLEKHILKASVHGNALNDRFSFIVSESYQPDDMGKHPNLDTIGLYPLLKGLQAEIKSLCLSKSYIGFGDEENSISAQERRYIKKYRNDITEYIKRIADYSRDDDLGSFLEQAFSTVRKDQFFPKKSRIPKPEYQIIPILTFLAEMKDAIITLESDKIFYKHHLTVTEKARLKAFGLSIQSMVKDISGTKRSAIITECILGHLLPDPNVTADQIHNELEQDQANVLRGFSAVLAINHILDWMHYKLTSEQRSSLNLRQNNKKCVRQFYTEQCEKVGTIYLLANGFKHLSEVKKGTTETGYGRAYGLNYGKAELVVNLNDQECKEDNWVGLHQVCQEVLSFWNCVLIPVLEGPPNA